MRVSRVIFEAWLLKKPVIARRSCLATASAVQTSGGGWLAEDKSDWISAIQHLIEIKEAEINEIGELGRAYSEKVANWNSVIDRYVNVLESGAQGRMSRHIIELDLKASINQKISIRIGDDLIGTCDLYANQVSQFTRTVDHHPTHQNIKFETNVEGMFFEPDPRTLGFRIHELSIKKIRCSQDQSLPLIRAGTNLK